MTMPYNKEIDARTREIVNKWKNIADKKMFGGVCYLLNGNMVCGVYKDYLILRLGEKPALKTMDLPFVKDFDITGRPMKGWVMVAEEGFADDNTLKDWLNQAKKFAKTLPPK